MLDPLRLVNDIFNEKNFSNSDLNGFAESFLIRLSQPENNPGGIYDQLLADGQNLHHQFYTELVGQSSQVGLNKGTTINLHQAFDAVLEKLRSLQGLIKYKYGTRSVVYKEFFPRGIAPYYHVSLAGAETLFIRFRAFATMHLQASYPAEVTELNTLVAAYATAWQARESADSNTDNISTTRHQLRKKLTLHLTKSFLIIASNNLENPNKFHDYYEKRYLPLRKGKKKSKGG